jgi:hypothetical protein
MVAVLDSRLRGNDGVHNKASSHYQISSRLRRYSLR